VDPHLLDVAINEIGDKLTAIRASRALTSVYWLGSAKFTNEALLPQPQIRGVLGHQTTPTIRPYLSLDHGRRRSQYLGYGAMTNSYTDIRNFQDAVLPRGNPAESRTYSVGDCAAVSTSCGIGHDELPVRSAAFSTARPETG